MSLLNTPREPELFPEDELRAAAGAVRETMLAALDKDTDPGRTFSPAFAIRMEPLLRLDRLRTGRRRFLQRAAVLLLAVLLTGSLILAVNPDARAAFFDWVRTVYEKSVVYEFFVNDPDPEVEFEEVPDVNISLLLDEYEAKVISASPAYSAIILSGEYTTLMLECWRTEKPSVIEIYTDDYTLEEVKVHGKRAEYYKSNSPENNNVLAWMDEEEKLFFNLSSESEKERLIEVAEKIK